MSGLYLLLPTFLVIVISFLVVRAGAIALMFTGMDEKRARFQALSAFTRTGFTTKEAEIVVKDPRRRQIITWLIVLGNAGIVTVIVTATSSLSSSEGYFIAVDIGILLVGVYLVYLVLKRTPLSRTWEKFIEKRFVHSEFLEEDTSEDLLHLAEGYGMLQVFITADSPFIGRSLLQANTEENEFWVVGIERGKEWISLPRSREIINDGDKLIVYGNLKTLRQLFKQE
jgi:hypothetical protein